MTKLEINLKAEVRALRLCLRISRAQHRRDLTRFRKIFNVLKERFGILSVETKRPIL